MMRIEKIKKKDEKNVIITFDNGERLYLAYDVFLKNGLKKNDDFSESRFSSLVEENQLFHLKQKAFLYLGRRLHSSYELMLKLKQKGYKQRLIEQVIEELIKGNYINDYEFASLFADENIRNKLWGRKKLEAELFRKGIDRNIILQIGDEKFSTGGELNQAVELGRKKIKSLQSRRIDSEKLKIKLVSFLMIKGYDYECSRRTVEILLEE
jgi:regulatory protein